MLIHLKLMGFALALAAIALGGTKYMRRPCNLTAVLGGVPTCADNIQWDNH
jgi:hypothetical protein